MQEIESMNVETSEKPKRGKRTEQNQHPDRVRIDPAGIARLNQLGSQVSERLRGVKLTRSDLVNFLILSHSESFSATEMKELESKHFDEVKFAQWALEELKVARIRGDNVRLSDIIASSSLRLDPKPKRRARTPKEQLDPAPTT